MEGKLIVIEGTDGSGKATQCKLLSDSIKKAGRDVVVVDFPQYGKPSAAMIEEYLNGRLGSAEEVGPYRASILYAVDRYAKSREMHDWLSQGKIIICNRYITANKGHQAGKIKDKEEVDSFLDWLDELEYGIFGIPRPDKVLLLYMPCELAQGLVDKKGHRDYVGGSRRDIHEADLGHLKAAERAYVYVAKKEGWEIIDCAAEGKILSIDRIHELILASVSAFIK